MNAKFCGECGSPLSEGARFCPQCGWKTGDPSQEQAQQYQTNTQAAANTQAQSNTQPQGQYTSVGSGGGFKVQPPQVNQNQYAQYPNQYPNQYANQYPNQYPNASGLPYQAPRKKRGGLVFGIIILLLVIGVGGYMLISKALNGGGILSAIGSSSGIAAEDLNGKWEITITPEKITVDGKESPDYSKAAGIKTKGELDLDLSKNGKGEGILQGETYGYPFADGVTAEYKGNRLTLKSEFAEYNYSTVYEGKVSKKGDSLIIDGTYTMESKDNAGLMKTTGKWTATMEGAASAGDTKSAGNSKAKKDVILSDIVGKWTGTAVYKEIKGFEDNVEKMKKEGMPDEALAMIREFEGSTVDFTLEIEETGEWTFELPFLQGEMMELGERDMLSDADRDAGQYEKYNINPEDGVFSLKSNQTEEGEGNFSFSFDGMVYDDGGLKIDGNISFEISFVDGAPITMVVDYKLTDLAPLE